MFGTAQSPKLQHWATHLNGVCLVGQDDVEFHSNGQGYGTRFDAVFFTLLQERLDDLEEKKVFLWMEGGSMPVSLPPFAHSSSIPACTAVCYRYPAGRYWIHHCSALHWSEGSRLETILISSSSFPGLANAIQIYHIALTISSDRKGNIYHT